MNVVCGQCGTGYEFDDALVSERGTTVRCTQCGFQFRVRPAASHGSGPERWIVRKVTGEEYIFRTLSELQRAISQRRVEIEDSLSRDGTTFRPMRELSELDCFFEPSQRSEASRAAVDTGTGSRAPSAAVNSQAVPPAHITARKVTPAGGFATAPPEAIASASHSPSATVNRGPDAQRNPSAAKPRGAQAVGPSTHADSNFAGDRVTPVVAEGLPRRRRGARHGEWEEGFAAPAEEVVGGSPAGSSGRAALAAQPAVFGSGAVAADVSQSSSESHTHSPLTVPPPERSMGLRWIVGLVLLGGMGLIAGTVGRDYLEQFRAQGLQLPSEQNARVEQYLAQGDELYRAGDLEEARAQFDKASVLAEGDPQVALRLLRIEATRADVEWLRLRLLADDASSVRKTTAARLEERVQKLTQRAQEYTQSAGEQTTPEGVGALVDALRIEEQTAKARALVEQSAGLGADHHAAYVSAMLDVAEPNPSWPSIISRLNQAVSGERGLGRAQAALVYALARSGDVEGAKQQLDVLSGFRRSHPLVDDLRAFIERSAEAGPQTTERASGRAPDEEERAEGALSPGSPDNTRTDTRPPRERGGESAAQSADPMLAAAEARAAGELARAGRLYTQALSQQPGNVAAMTGLGDVARSQGNTDIALSHYGAALRQNPNYAPAVLACADLKWATGDRAGAVELYRRLAPGGPERVARRIAEFEKGSATKSGATTSSASPPDVAPTGSGPANAETVSGPAPRSSTEVRSETTPEPPAGQSSP